MYSERCISWKRCEGQHEIHGEPKHDRFHSNVIVAHGVLQTFDRCRPFHETKFSRINVCTERFWNKIKIAQLFLSSLLFPWCKYIHLQVLKGKRCDFKTPTQKLSILNKQFVLDVNRCEWLQSYRGIALFVCLFFCMSNTDLNICCKLAHGRVCSEWCRWRYTTESKIICHRFAAFGGHCSRFGLLWLFLL